MGRFNRACIWVDFVDLYNDFDIYRVNFFVIEVDIIIKLFLIVWDIWVIVIEFVIVFSGYLLGFEEKLLCVVVIIVVVEGSGKYCFLFVVGYVDNGCFFVYCCGWFLVYYI